MVCSFAEGTVEAWSLVKSEDGMLRPLSVAVVSSFSDYFAAQELHRIVEEGTLTVNLCSPCRLQWCIPLSCTGRFWHSWYSRPCRWVRTCRRGRCRCSGSSTLTHLSGSCCCYFWASTTRSDSINGALSVHRNARHVASRLRYIKAGVNRCI